MKHNELERRTGPNYQKKLLKNIQNLWKTVRDLKGNKSQVNQYLIVNNIKINKDEDKEGAHRDILEDVFKISHQENAVFDREKEVEVERYIEVNQDKVNTYVRSDVNRLDGRNFIDSLITQVEIKSHKNF